jgi:molybdate transport system substrate-binding protein
LKATVFPRLGISDAVAGKLSSAGGTSVATGEAEMVILPVSEILPVAGVDFVGTIPAEIQFDQVFAAAIVKGARDPDAAKRLIAFLASKEATPVVEQLGMKRTQPR